MQASSSSDSSVFNFVILDFAPPPRSTPLESIGWARLGEEVPNDGIVLSGRLAAVASSFRPHCGFFFQGIWMFLSSALQLL